VAPGCLKNLYTSDLCDPSNFFEAIMAPCRTDIKKAPSLLLRNVMFVAATMIAP